MVIMKYKPNKKLKDHLKNILTCTADSYLTLYLLFQ